MHAESLAIRLLPPGVVDGGPAEDDPDAWVGAVQVVHSQCLLISRPSNDEDNNILGPVIKTHIQNCINPVPAMRTEAAIPLVSLPRPPFISVMHWADNTQTDNTQPMKLPLKQSPLNIYTPCSRS